MNFFLPHWEYVAKSSDNLLQVKPTFWMYFCTLMSGPFFLFFAWFFFENAIHSQDLYSALMMSLYTIISLMCSVGGFWYFSKTITTQPPTFDKSLGLFFASHYSAPLKCIRKTTVIREEKLQKTYVSVGYARVPMLRYKTVVTYHAAVILERSQEMPEDASATYDVAVSKPYSDPERPKTLASEIARFLDLPDQQILPPTIAELSCRCRSCDWKGAIAVHGLVAKTPCPSCNALTLFDMNAGDPILGQRALGVILALASAWVLAGIPRSVETSLALPIIFLLSILCGLGMNLTIWPLDDARFANIPARWLLFPICGFALGILYYWVFFK